MLDTPWRLSSLDLDDLHCIIVDRIDPAGHTYFNWLNENDIFHYKWCYYSSSIKFGFDCEESMVKFGLRWA